MSDPETPADTARPDGPEVSLDPEEILRERVLKNDPRYPPAAYLFLYQALAYTQKMLGRDPANPDERKRHVTGQELLEGIRRYAEEQFGRLAPPVFRAWGIHNTRDFGHMVFNLVQARLMSKTDSDSLHDFEDGFEFDEAFDGPVSLR